MDRGRQSFRLYIVFFRYGRTHLSFAPCTMSTCFIFSLTQSRCRPTKYQKLSRLLALQGTDIPAELILFRDNGSYVDRGTGLHYTNAFDMGVDAFISAIRLAGYSNMEVVVGEAGRAEIVLFGKPVLQHEPLSLRRKSTFTEWLFGGTEPRKSNAARL